MSCSVDIVTVLSNEGLAWESGRHGSRQARVESGFGSLILNSQDILPSKRLQESDY